MKKNKTGFTLIELLIVISIIGVLSSVVISSLKTAREKARDAQRLSDVKQIQTALEMFYNENNGKIFEAMMSLYENRDPIDVLTVSDWLKTSFLTKLFLCSKSQIASLIPESKLINSTEDLTNSIKPLNSSSVKS